MADEKKYKVKMGDPFGGFATIGKDLTIQDAVKLDKEASLECDYFTSTYIEDENGKEVYDTKKLLANGKV